MDFKFCVLKNLTDGVRSDFVYNMGDLLDVLNHLPNNRFFTIITVVHNSLYRYEYYSGNITSGEPCSLFGFVDFLDRIKKGEI